MAGEVLGCGGGALLPLTVLLDGSTFERVFEAWLSCVLWWVVQIGNVISGVRGFSISACNDG